MLSDTLHDNLNATDILADIATYRDDSETYQYPPSLLDEVSQLTIRLLTIQQNLDSGIY